MKNFGQIQSDVIRLARISSTDTVSTAAILSDSNDAINIIASMRDWDELDKQGTILTDVSDGDKVYPLASDVDKMDTAEGSMRITLPQDYSRPIYFIERKLLREMMPQKLLNSTSTPTKWYYSEPTISTYFVETKNISFDAMPDRAYTIVYNYKSYPPQITELNDYPFFSGNYHHIIVQYCLWMYALRNPDPTLEPTYFRGEWENGVQELLNNYGSKITEQSPIPGPNHA